MPYENARTGRQREEVAQTEVSQSGFYYKTASAAPSCWFLASNTTLPGTVFILNPLSDAQQMDCQLQSWISCCALGGYT